MPIWIGDNGTWTNAANWSGAVPDSIGALADFPISSNGGTLTIGVPENLDITIGRMFITGTGTSGILIRGSAVDSGTGVGTLVFNNNNYNPYAILTVDTLAGGGPTVFSSASGLIMRLDDDLFVTTVNSGTTTRFDLDVSGSGQLLKSGNGILELNGTNSFTGGIVIYDGLLDVAGDASLGSGSVTIAFNAMFLSAGTIDNDFRTGSLAVGNDGSGQIVAATGTTMMLTGALNHDSQGTMTFGSFGNNGTIVANFGSITHNATRSSFGVSGGTLRLGSAYVAANLFSQPSDNFGDRLALTEGGIIDTSGFATVINNGLVYNLDGRIRSSSGTLNLTISGSVNSGGFGGTGIIEGTSGADQVVFNITGSADMIYLSFVNWTAGVDQIQINGSNSFDGIYATEAGETINGLDGNDVLSGGGGIDTINGGNGDDIITLALANSGSFVHGGADTDTLQLIGGSISVGGISSIEAIILFGGANIILTGAQFATGLASNTALSGTGSITVNMTASVNFLASGMNFASGATTVVNGTSGIDIIKLGLGTSTGNTVNGGDGVDQIRGSNGVDTINGQVGNDKIMSLGGADILTGGSGADQFRYFSDSDSGLGANADRITDFLSGTDKLNFLLIDPDPLTVGDQAFLFVDTLAFTNTGVAQIRWVDLGADLRVEADVNGDGVADMHILLQGAGAQVLTAADFIL
ncbi:MAG: hypothetical protein IPN50_14110 [Sphingomonadales bacterium]|nr:hypothetical protein [Sphingomonadales bacterium]MBK9433472.1 hypothetical protein [Sphingomonadales bacterium]MBL0020891.1 hypothetical protein [Sphingomonadales bacterium]